MKLKVVSGLVVCVGLTLGGCSKAPPQTDSSAASISDSSVSSPASATAPQNAGGLMSQADFEAFEKQFPPQGLNAENGVDSSGNVIDTDLSKPVKYLESHGWNYDKAHSTSLTGANQRFCDFAFANQNTGSAMGQQIVITAFCAGDGKAEDGSDADNTVADYKMNTQS